MVREDILAALQNAIERSESIEEARQSLINAGYTPTDVEEAIGSLMSEEKNAELLPIIEERRIPVPQALSEGKKEGIFSRIARKIKKDKILFILIAVFLVLGIALAATFLLLK